MSANVFRFFRPPGEEKEDRSEKRRAQVRRAQQTYRLRKDNYARALEREVTRLRSIEATLAVENERLLEVIRAQEHLLAEKRTWGDLWDGLSSGDHIFRESDLSSPPSNLLLGLGANTPALPCSNTSPSCQTDGSQVSPAVAAIGGQASPIAFLPPFDSFDAVASQPQRNPSDLTATGMEFVLALESPCLSHIHAHTHDPTASAQHHQHQHQHPYQTKETDTEEPRVNGHALTAAYYILSLSPSSPSAPLSAASPTNDPQSDDAVAAKNKAAVNAGMRSTPNGILDRLLTLATSFALEDEITPVQAWERIRPFMEGGSLGMAGKGPKEVVRTLLGRLAGLVKCHGFGAVVKKEAFEQVLREFVVRGEGW